MTRNGLLPYALCIVFSLSAVLAEGSGEFKCYSCSYSDGQKDLCLNYPLESINKISCPQNRSCITKRMTYTETKGIFSFLRSCVVKQYESGCVQDVNHLTCTQYCHTDLCNNGDGVPKTPNPPDSLAQALGPYPATMLLLLLLTALTTFLR